MTDHIDLKELSIRESEQVEWKENVADTDDVVQALSAFANDWGNLGGGYVVCGAAEARDEHGFPYIKTVGLTAARLKEVEGEVLTGCRERVSPAIVPLVQELPADSPDHRILVFVMPATRHPHLFRRRDEAGPYYVRISRNTMEARNGVLRELLVRKGDAEPWDHEPCKTATRNDLDLLALREFLQRIDFPDPDTGIEQYLSDTKSFHALVPPLYAREPLTGTLRPRNFAMLLFGRNLQQHIPGAHSYFSIYPGVDRGERHGERNELTGTLLDQYRRLTNLLDEQCRVAYDRASGIQNAEKYPRRALQEAMVNALAHRDYSLHYPTRITAFSDRIEILSPGALLGGVSLEQLRQGQAPPKWRNQSLVWFLSRLDMAQAEGQGITTILRTMYERGCPPPRFEANEWQLVCTLPAHPRHALATDRRRVTDAILTGDLDRARMALNAAVGHLESAPVDWDDEVASIGNLFIELGDHRAAVDFMDARFRGRPELNENAAVLLVRGNALLGLARGRSVVVGGIEASRESTALALRDLRAARNLAADAPTLTAVLKALAVAEEWRPGVRP